MTIDNYVTNCHQIKIYNHAFPMNIKKSNGHENCFFGIIFLMDSSFDPLT